MQVPNLTLEIDVRALPRCLFVERLKARDLREVRTFRWEKSSGNLGDVFPENRVYGEWAEGTNSSGEVIIETDEVVALVQVSGAQVIGRVAGADPHRFLSSVHSVLVPTALDDRTVDFDFWRLTRFGPASENRLIEIEMWPEIMANYPSPIRSQLNDLMELSEPHRNGRLFLWQGSPGTGKTTAIRALAGSWRRWCSFHYVLDPERLFGDASYLYDVALNAAPENDRWIMLILEDTGELLTADAKSTNGQALSRLLNIVDGILGQGLRVMILVTTNEDQGSLHPAVSRPGRCGAQIEFGPFSHNEAEEWFAGQGVPIPAGPPRVLADMFSAKEGSDARIIQSSFGFSR